MRVGFPVDPRTEGASRTGKIGELKRAEKEALDSASLVEYESVL